MSIYRHKNGWRAEAWINNVRVASKGGFTSKFEAQNWRDLQRVNFLSGKFKTAEEDISFDELLNRFEEIHYPTVSPGTKRRYEIEIAQRIRPYFQFRKLTTISPMDVESYRSKQLKVLAPKSVNVSMGLLGTIFRKGVEWGMLDKNPVRLRPVKIQERKYLWWDKKEHILRFLRAAKSTPHYAAFKLALECGLRLGEIIGLSKADVDLKRCQIHIHRQWLDKQFCYGPTKGRRERFINFNPTSGLKEALAEAILRSPHAEAIFVTQLGTRLRPCRLAEKHFQRVVKKAGVPRIRFHDLRHTFSSWYMLEQDDIWSLKAILGHVDVQTTQRYAHLSRKHQRVVALSFSVDEHEIAAVASPHRNAISPTLSPHHAKG